MLCIPQLACNLFSVRATSAKGNSLKFSDTQCWIRDGNGKLLGTGSLIEKLYYLNCDTPASKVKAAIVAGCETGGKADIWHRRTGHLNESQLREMVTHEMVKGINMPKNADVSFCESCVQGKMARKPFKSMGEIKATWLLQRVHSDVRGPFSTESIGRKRYFVTFTDDYSRCC